MSSQKNRAILIQEKLERHFLHGLACEWECAQEFLNAQNKVKLRKPSFSLRDMNGKWGYWSPEKKEICLNRDLLYNHTWGAVREILIHEMAHQFAEQALGGHDEPPHGPKCKGGRP
jgi:predicted SprT family Zn-dependent metalloprotease